MDSGNKFLKTGLFGASLLDVPANPPRFDQVQDVPHGTLQIRSYMSTPYKKQRDLYVYLPPQYDREPSRRFPVLYLRHGNGDDEAAWTIEGRAGVILENLIAEGKAVPMIIVMPYGESNAFGGGTPEGIAAALGSELLDDVIPLMDKNYRTLTGRDNRAIAWLSMGGGQAFTIGPRNLDRFALASSARVWSATPTSESRNTCPPSLKMSRASTRDSGCSFSVAAARTRTIQANLS